MVYKLINMFMLFLCIIVMSAKTKHKHGKVICAEIPDNLLEEILGPAFNARYMSISEPYVEVVATGNKRETTSLEFYVENDFVEDLEGRPAWMLTNHVEAAREVGDMRYRRSVDYLQEWQCKTQIKWTDLGPDYFPRYLRSVECLTDKCWFNMYKCKPRSFTVKLLKRKRDRCVVAEIGTKIGTEGLPKELKQMWVWEERAVTFCCDCTM